MKRRRKCEANEHIFSFPTPLMIDYVFIILFINSIVNAFIILIIAFFDIFSDYIQPLSRLIFSLALPSQNKNLS